MALKINRPSPYGGEDFTYFIIGNLDGNRLNGFTTINLYGFINAEARRSEANFIVVRLPIPANASRNATIEQLYDIVKSTPEFSEATDV